MDDATLSRLFAPLDAAAGVGLAVSGGPDSLALALLARRWADRRSGLRLVVLTVDHGLRLESAAEAVEVARFAGSLDLECRVLRWEGPAPEADIEAAAREARYGLLLAAARQEGLTHIATAHHRDDQAETLLLRLARGSGVYGLSGMPRISSRDGIQLVRPLLELSRAELAAIVQEAGLAAADDPHNRDPRFARARMRRLMPVLAEEGLTSARLAATASRLRRAAAALDYYADRLLEAAAEVDAFGTVRLQAAPWRAAPEEVRLRTLARILRAAGGAEYGPRLDSLAALEESLRGGDLQSRTLGGVVVSADELAFCFERELGRDGLAAIEVDDAFDGVWDRRFRLAFTPELAGVRIAALGPQGRAVLPAAERRGSLRAIEASPALWAGGRLLAAPIAAPGAGIAVRAHSIVGERLLEAVEVEDS